MLNRIIITVMFIIVSFNISIIAQRILQVGPGKTYADPRAACLAAKAGDTVLIFPATYPGGYFIENLKGTRNARITIKGVDANTVIFSGSSEAIHFIEAENVNLMNITITRQTGNGINIDDGGTFETPTKNILIENVIFRDMNATGNNDMLKLSGLDSFEIRGCTFLNGSVGGSGIDMVGCHWGTIHHNQFTNQGSNSIQAKGATHNIVIQANKFINGGGRALNLGGSTGQAFFRPAGANYEAKELFVYSNFFQGSEAPIAYVGCRNSIVSNNTFYNPGKWIFRILQESADTSFYLSSANNTFSNNIVFVNNIIPTINIGPNTSPTSFTINNNLWYCEVNTGWRGPSLPVTETNGIYGMNPLFMDLSKGNINLLANSPARGKGKDSLNFTDYYNRRFSYPPSIGASEYDPNTSFELSVDHNDIKFYPNPVQDYLFIRNIESAVRLEVFRIDGIKVFAANIVGELEINTKNWSAGVYLITIQNELNKKYISRFIKQ